MAKSSSTLLRVVTQRLSNTPSIQLPNVAPILARIISQCTESLNVPESGSQNTSNPDDAIHVHKLRTQLSALLLDRTAGARYTAVILIKATVESGSYEILQRSTPWIHGLLHIIDVSSSLIALLRDSL